MKTTKKIFAVLMSMLVVLIYSIPITAFADIEGQQSDNGSVVSEPVDVADEGKDDTAIDNDAAEPEPVVDNEDADADTDEDADTEDVSSDDVNDSDAADSDFNYSGNLDGISVEISAASGVLPEGTIVSLAPLNKSQLDAVNSDDVDNIIGLDISFRDAEGNVIEPNGNVHVKYTSSELAGVDEADMTLVHISDAGEILDENVDSTLKDGVLSFSADEFTAYVALLDFDDFHKEPSVVENTMELNKVVGDVFRLGSDLGSYDDKWTVTPADSDVITVSAGGLGGLITGNRIDVKAVKSGKVTITHSYVKYERGKKVNHKDIYIINVTEDGESGDTVKVAVYATDGAAYPARNSELETALGLSYKQPDGYYPIGVVYLPERLFVGSSPYINNTNDWNTIKAALGTIDKTQLTGDGLANQNNLVGSKLEYVQYDESADAGSLMTAMFDWKWGGEAYNAISLIDNKPYAYHLDLRFATGVIEYNANADDASDTMVDTVQLKDTSGVISGNLPANQFTRAGYTFAGWNTEPDGKGTAYEDKQAYTLSANNTVLYAQWEKDTEYYTVTVKYVDDDNRTVELKDSETTGAIVCENNYDVTSIVPEQIQKDRENYVKVGQSASLTGSSSENLEITVYYGVDELIDQDGNGDLPGDGIADKYQATVYFEVVDGAWNEFKDGQVDKESQSKVITFYKDVNGTRVPSDADDAEANLGAPAAGNNPDAGFKSGAWNPVFDEETGIVKKSDIPETATYTYTYNPCVYVYINIVDESGRTLPEASKPFTINVGNSDVVLQANKDGWITLGDTDLSVDSPKNHEHGYVYPDFSTALLSDFTSDKVNAFIYEGDTNSNLAAVESFWSAIDWTSLKVIEGGAQDFTPTGVKTWHLDGEITVDSLTYDANGGTGSMNPTKGISGATVPVSANGFSKPGYHFDGWNTVKQPTEANPGTYYSAGSEYLLNKSATDVLYAQWVSNDEYTVTVDYVDEDGNTVKPSEKTDSILKGIHYDVTDKAYNDIKVGNNHYFKVNVSGNLTGVIEQGNDTSAVTVTVIYALDNLTDTDSDLNGGTPGDGIADKYQKEITYAVRNGYWNGTDEDESVKTEVVTFYKKNSDGTKDVLSDEDDAVATLDIPAVGSNPATGYLKNGGWSPEVGTTVTKKDIKDLYTFTYVQSPVYVYLKIVDDEDKALVVEDGKIKVNVNGDIAEFALNETDKWATIGSTDLLGNRLSAAEEYSITGEQFKAIFPSFNPVTDITGYTGNSNKENADKLWGCVDWLELKVVDSGATDYTGYYESTWHLDGQLTIDRLAYNANGGSGTMSDEESISGAAVTVAENSFTRPGYVFKGWNTQANGEGTSYAKDSDYVLQKGEDDVLYAQWESIPSPIIPPFTPESVYTVTYMDGVDDEVVFDDQSTTNLKKGDKTPAFAGEPIREGYKFIGWSPEVAETVTGDAVYYAQWEKLPEEPSVVDPSGDNDPIDDGKDIDAQPNGDADTEAKGVKTGDETMLAMWGALGLIAALGLGGALVIGRRREE